MAKPRVVYWDACAWIAYINREMPRADTVFKEPRFEMCRDTLKRAEAGEYEIATSAWYVKSGYTASQAVDHIKPALDANDKVYVVDATNNNAAWNSLPENVADHIKDQWHR